MQYTVLRWLLLSMLWHINWLCIRISSLTIQEYEKRFYNRYYRGSAYRFFQFQWTYKQLTWDIIVNAYARQYKPLQEYGGWGIRFGFAESGTAYTISGKHGLQLVYDKGKRLLIGTQKPDEVENVLKKVEKYK